MSIKQLIIHYLEERVPRGSYEWAGKIDDYIRSQMGSKASNVSRRCRELEKSGVLEVAYEQVDGKGPKCAKYRLRSELVAQMWRIKEEFISDIKSQLTSLPPAYKEQPTKQSKLL